MAPAPKDGSSSRFHPYDKKAKGKHIKPRPQPGPSVNELKRRIRDVKRVLNHKDLPTDARIVQERALAGYEKDLKEELERRKRSEMIKRYHFVRFLGESVDINPKLSRTIIHSFACLLNR